jgi:hypothetical protein
LAQALHGWLPLVLHYVKPWLSDADVSAGDRWATVVAKELEISNFGVICVTPENINSPWVLFEAGALAKGMQGAKVIPAAVQSGVQRHKRPFGSIPSQEV